MKRLSHWLVRTLAGKTIVAILAVFIVGLVIFSNYGRVTGQSILESWSGEYERVLSRLFHSYVDHLMLDHLEINKKGNLHELLQDLSKDDDFAGGMVLSKDGKMVAWSADSLLPRISPDDLRLADNNPDGIFLHWNGGKDGEVVFLQPLLNRPPCQRCHGVEDDRRGYIATWVNQQALNALTLPHRRTIRTITVLTLFALAITTIVVMHVLVTHPIADMSRDLHALTLGLVQQEDGSPANVPTLKLPVAEDELKLLTADMNSLITRLNLAQNNLREVHEQQLAQADRLATTGEIAASLAHEIRNPLAGVMGALKVMSTQMEAGDPHLGIVSEMRTELDRINKTLTDLLSFARPSDPEFESTNLIELVDHLSSLLESQAGPCQIITEQSPVDVWVKADQKQLHQSLLNLALNGLQSMPGGGSLTVRTYIEDNQGAIEITDEGVGIPEDELETIFRPFYTSKARGTGLGLAIVKRIIGQHSGEISIQSREGEGTQVNIYIPLDHNHS